jgi:hypothetical protein
VYVNNGVFDYPCSAEKLDHKRTPALLREIGGQLKEDLRKLRLRPTDPLKKRVAAPYKTLA